MNLLRAARRLGPAIAAGLGPPTPQPKHRIAGDAAAIDQSAVAAGAARIREALHCARAVLTPPIKSKCWDQGGRRQRSVAWAED